MASTGAQKVLQRQRRRERVIAEREYTESGEPVPTVLEALCHSVLCASGNNGRLLRDVASTASFCPRCGHALFWRRRKLVS